MAGQPELVAAVRNLGCGEGGKRFGNCRSGTRIRKLLAERSVRVMMMLMCVCVCAAVVQGWGGGGGAIHRHDRRERLRGQQLPKGLAIPAQPWPARRDRLSAAAAAGPLGQ